MKTIQLRVPDDLDLKGYDFSMIIASKLFEEGKLSSGQAAEMVGLTKRAYIEVIGKFAVSTISNSLTDLYSDISNAWFLISDTICLILFQKIGHLEILQ